VIEKTLSVDKYTKNAVFIPIVFGTLVNTNAYPMSADSGIFDELTSLGKKCFKIEVNRLSQNYSGLYIWVKISKCLLSFKIFTT